MSVKENKRRREENAGKQAKQDQPSAKRRAVPAQPTEPVLVQASFTENEVEMIMALTEEADQEFPMEETESEPSNGQPSLNNNATVVYGD